MFAFNPLLLQPLGPVTLSYYADCVDTQRSLFVVIKFAVVELVTKYLKDPQVVYALNHLQVKPNT